MNDEILTIVRNNLRNLMYLNGISSFRELASFTGISADTIRKWFKNNGSQPRMATLDTLCDCFSKHTSDLFLKNSDFSHSYEKNNDSQGCFIKNFNKICIKNSKLIKVQSRIDLLFDSDKNLYYSLLSKNRAISMDRLEWLVHKMKPYISDELSIYDLLK